MMVVIPARGNSKGIPGKNVRRVAGQPLIWWALDAAAAAQSVDRIVVATDDVEIAHVASAHRSGRVEIYERTQESATDQAPTETVLLEVANSYTTEVIACIQATSPLVMRHDIDHCASLVVDEGYDSAMTVVRQKRFYWKNESEVGIPLNYDPKSRPRRQDMEGALVENGAVYVTMSKSLIEQSCRISGRIGLVEMPESSYFEIDEPDDLAIIEAILRARKHIVQEVPRSIKLVMTDVDGVLTNNLMYYDATGESYKGFSARDGKGFELLRNHGIEVGIVTSEVSPAVRSRAAKLQVRNLIEGSVDKLSDVSALCCRLDIDIKEVAYIGDDLNDLELLEAVGYSMAPKDAHASARGVAMALAEAEGGSGCFRELADTILLSRA